MSRSRAAKGEIRRVPEPPAAPPFGIATALSLERLSGEQTFRLLDEMPMGVAIYDPDDRLIRCNRWNLERWGKDAGVYRPGRRFEDIVRDLVAAGRMPQATGREDAYLTERLARHGRQGPPFEVQIDDVWYQVSEQVVPGVGTVVFRIDITERKHAQAALEHSEQRFRDFAESASDSMWETDAEFRFVHHSACADSPHLPPPGRTRWENAGIYDPESDPKWAPHLEDLRAHRAFRDFRFSVGGGDVPVQHLRVSGRPVFDAVGDFAGYRGTTTVETAAVEAETRRAQVYKAIENVLVGVALYDEQDRLVMRNNVERDFGEFAPFVTPGVTFEELFRMMVRHGVFEEAKGREEAFVQERLAHHRNPSGPFEQKRRDRWLLVRDNRLENGHTMVILTDITDLKRAEAALRQSEAKFRHLVDGALQGVCIHRGFKPLFANQAFADLYGFGGIEEVLRFDSLLELFPAEQHGALRERSRDRLTGARGPETVVQAALRRTGEVIFVESRVAAIEWEGEPALQITVIDVTERETAARLKDEFVSTVSHELRTPLTSVSGALGLISSGMAGHLPPKARELIEIANNNAERLVRLINDILDVQKIESGAMRGRRDVVDLADLLDAAAEANQGFAAREGIAIQVAHGAPGARVLGDMDQLMQILTNLLSNAVKFSPPQSRIEVASRRGGGHVCIAVHDEGPGIPAEFRDRIFEKFVQVGAPDRGRRGGTGLGLSICKALVERHGGTIAFECPPQGGTVFSIVLPEHYREAAS